MIKKYINSYTFFIVFAVLFSIFLLRITINRDVHILTDAAYYLMGADSFQKKNNFTSYNIGYLENEEIADFKKQIPIVRYQPLYSFTTASVAKLFSTNILTSSKLVNIFSFLIFSLSWIYIYNKLFYKRYIFILSAIFIFSSYGIYTYLLPPHSEMLFCALISVLAVVLYKYYSGYQKLTHLILIIVALTMIYLTRYAGIGFVIAFFITLFILYFTPGFRISKWHFFIIFLGFIAVYILWSYRTFLVSGQMSRKLYSSSGSLFDIERIIEIINIFFTSTLNTPGSIENLAWLLVIPIFFALGTTFYFKTYEKTPLNLWLLLSLFIYTAMIVYLGLKNREVDTINGFMRFLFIMQPFLIGTLLSVLQSSELSTNIFSKISKYTLILIIGFSLISGINRTRIFFSTLPPNETQTEKNFYKQISKIATENDLILSNQWQNVSARTSLPVIQFHFINEIESLRTKYEGKYQKNYMVLLKNVGVTYRKEVPSWEKILEKINYTKIKETDKAIFVLVHQTQFK